MTHRLLVCLLALISVFSATNPTSAARLPQPPASVLPTTTAAQPHDATAANSFAKATDPAPNAVASPAAGASSAALLVRATDVAVGAEHTCVLTNQGGVKCWGSNYYGQLGNNTTTNSATPVDVSGLTSGVAAVAAGGYHTCAVMDTVHGSGVKCWGDNAYGQLGDNTLGDAAHIRTLPVDVLGLAGGVAAVAGGGSHTCARMTNGAVKCWGDNAAGQLGDGTTAGRLTPVGVSGLDGLLAGATTVAAGGYHTCAVTTGGGLKCWGRNGEGQVGDGTKDNRKTPVDVNSGVAAVATGERHTCAVMDAVHGGAVECWGLNFDGQLGDGTTASSAIPVSALTSGAAGVAAGGYHTCARMTDGSVKCWGSNAYGQLGNGTVADSAIPVSGLAVGLAALASSAYHTCALMDADHGGGVKCWGDNTSGELGDGRTTNNATPVEVSGLTAARPPWWPADITPVP